MRVSNESLSFSFFMIIKVKTMSKYELDDLHNYTIINGIVVVGEGGFLFLGDETMTKINTLILESCNDPETHRKIGKDGRIVK